MSRGKWIWALAGLMLVPSLATAAVVDELVSKLAGNDEVAKPAARRALLREDPATVVHKLLPLVAENNRPV